jgi:hypothetical protein
MAKEQSLESETDSQFLKRMISGDQELRLLFQKDIDSTGRWSQELVDKFVEKNKTQKDDVFGDTIRMEEFIQREPSFNYSEFSDDDWKSYYIFVMHMDNYPKIQFKALRLFEDQFEKNSNRYKNLLFRMARHRGLVNIPKDYKVNLDNIEDEAKKFGVDWDQLSSKVNGLHDTYWINEEGKKTTLIDLLDATENIKAEKISIGWLKPHLLDWNNEKEEIEKIEKADLRYPILIFVDNKGEFLSIIDGHHRAQKAVMHQMKSIDGKIIPIDSLPADIREVFNFW